MVLGQDGAELVRGSAGKRPTSLAHGKLSTQRSDILRSDNGSIAT